MTSPTSLPLASLLRQKTAGATPPLNWAHLLLRMRHEAEANCGRPFCKLKRREHFHCFECNNAFSDVMRLRTHIIKHGVLIDPENNIQMAPASAFRAGVHMVPIDAAARVAMTTLASAPVSGAADLRRPAHDEGESEEEAGRGGVTSSSLNLNPQQFTSMLAQSQLSCDSDVNTNVNNNASHDAIERFVASQHKRVLLTSHADDEAEPPSKVARRDEPEVDDDVMAMYTRFSSRDECVAGACVYRMHAAHFHCRRERCRFATADRKRLPRHAMRHRKTDDVIGDEFEQVRMSGDCGRVECRYKGRCTHYHCTLCSYTCVELSKVKPHRRHHARTTKLTARIV